MREGRLKNLIKTGILGKDVCDTCETHYGLTFCNEGSSKGMTTPMNPLIILNFIFRSGREVRRRLHSLHPDHGSEPFLLYVVNIIKEIGFPLR